MLMLPRVKMKLTHLMCMLRTRVIRLPKGLRVYVRLFFEITRIYLAEELPTQSLHVFPFNMTF